MKRAVPSSRWGSWLLASSAAALLSAATSEREAFEAYSEGVPGTNVRFEMVPVAGGRFEMGRDDGPEDERPAHPVRVSDFWISRHEVTWEAFDAFRTDGELPVADDDLPEDVDGVTRPTPPYADESFGYGKKSQPVISVTHHAARTYARWLSERTGRRYRLPTEAEWEYACRTGEGTATSDLDERVSDYRSSDGRPRPVGGRAPDGLGLHDMLGNVAEWVEDRYDEGAYSARAAEGPAADPLVQDAGELYPHVVRGGSFADDLEEIGCSARSASDPKWSRRDPQRPQSIWWHTDAHHVGFRIVRVPGEDE
jgi:formylglycine-generating enzyme required for sulfatase activity